MATKTPSGAAGKPEVGETLMVIHDFMARSSDELTLTKGDRVELIERDDEFGDGWFLGKHLSNGNTGLFPEVYTRPAPKATAATTPPTAAATPTPLAPLAESSLEKPEASIDDGVASAPASAVEPPQITLPLQSAKAEPKIDPVVAADESAPASLKSPTEAGNNGQDSQVLNETLNVINEHITNLRSPASNSGLRTQGDSGSEYSASLHHRMSYIQGEETDEEEEATHTRAEVEAWTPDDVAEFLFTSGVEKQHCEVFRDQDISGEVLLTMDQGSLFIKAFDLGSVGRRLKTWHKIKALQDEVANDLPTSRPGTQAYGSDVASDEGAGGGSRGRARTSTLTSNHNAQPSLKTHRLSASYNPTMAPLAGTPPQASPTQTDHRRRPSAASVRNLHHSRRHSSTDYHTSNPATPRYSINGGGATPNLSHKKQSSFDRNWTLGGAASSQRIIPGESSDPDLQDSAVDMDRGYFSGTETESRTRNLLRKRESVAAESRKSSYADEQRVRSATALSRHSRFGSVESYRDSSAPTASQKYHGTPHRRTASTNTTESVRPVPPAKDTPPTVTRLEDRGSKGPTPPAKDGDWLSSLVQRPMRGDGFGIRAISDNLGLNRNKHSIDSNKNSLPSPAATGGSSTPSAGPSLDLDSPTAGKVVMGPGAQQNTRARGRKGKKETSAYTRGLLNIPPREAMADADYSGWMRKKSSNLMTTWKPRFFVLKGRRLAYYYSEDDESEKGLIDISYHRVLAADNEKLTGIHASITGVVAGHQALPTTGGAGSATTSPTTPHAPEDLDKGDEGMFIFKLVPPKAGMSRGVHFTKPTVHYFAVPNLKQGRLWMAALMKATIDRDDSQPITTTYQQKTISLAKAKQMRSRPPALMNLDEVAVEDEANPDALGLYGDTDAASSTAPASSTHE